MKKFKSLIIAISIVLVMAIALPTGLILGLRNNDSKTTVQQEVEPQEDTTKGKLIGGIYYAAAGEQTGASEAPITEKGAIYVNDGATVTIGEDAVISGHESLYGGAIYVASGGTLIVNGGTITNNTSRLGGAIYVEENGTVEFKKENALGQTTTGGQIYGNYSEPIDNAIGDAEEETAAVYAEYGANIITPENCSISDNIPQYYGNYLIYNVDGVNSYVSTGYEETEIFNLTDAPLDYEHCCGYFINEDMLTSVEDQDEMIYETYTTTNHRTFKKFNGLYTKTATLEKLSFVLNSDNQTYNVRRIDSNVSGNIVIPRQYNDKDVTSIYGYHYYYSDGSSSGGGGFINTDITSICMPNTIESVGAHAFSGCHKLTGTLSIPDSVRSIGYEAFYSCYSIGNIRIGTGLSEIGSYAFSGTYGLVEILNKSNLSITAGDSENIGLGSYALAVIDDESNKGVFSTENGAVYYSNENIENMNKVAVGLVNKESVNLVISDDCEQIKSGAFYYCEKLTNVTFSSGMKDIGVFAFRGCDRLTSVDIPELVTNIKSGVFSNCSNLYSVTVPEDVASIDDSAFSGCDRLVEVINKSSLEITKGGTGYGGIARYALAVVDNEDDGGLFTTAADGVVYYTNEKVSPQVSKIAIGLTSDPNLNISIDADCNKINNFAFHNCDNLNGVTISDNVTSIGNSAFSYCDNLTDILYGANITSFGSLSNIFTYSGNQGTGITLTIGDNVTGIPGYLFYASGMSVAARIKHLIIPSNVTSIGGFAFYNCSYIERIDYNANISTAMTANNNVFYGAGRLGKGIDLVIGNNVTSLPDYLFYAAKEINAPKIVSVTVGTNVSRIGETTFSNCVSITEVCNLSSQNIVLNSEGFGYIAKYALIVVTDVNEKGLFEDDGEVYYTNSLKNIPKTMVCDSVHQDVSLDIYYTFVINDDCVAIKRYAFKGDTRLRSITIPANLASIGYYSFYGCTGLTDVNYEGELEDWFGISFGDRWINSSWTLYKNNQSVTDLEVSSSVSTVPAYSFYGCSGLTSITIPSSVIKIGINAFSSCTGLTQINWDATNLTTALASDSEIFYSAGTAGTGITVTFGNTVQSIPGYLFYVSGNSYNPKITNVTIGDNVTSIGDSAFEGCKLIPSININTQMNSIGSKAFYGCAKLSKIYYAGGITGWCGMSFGTNWNNTDWWLYFSDTKVTTLVVPTSIIAIPARAFYNHNPISIYYDGSIEQWFGIDFGYGWAYRASWSLWCKNDSDEYDKVTNITVPESITSIKLETFYYCKSLTSITIHDSVKSINDYAFAYCSNLNSVTLGTGVKSLGKGVFYSCSGITSISIPNAVDAIPQYTFYGCTYLSSVTIGSGVGEIDDYAFYNCTSLTSITIPYKVERLGMYSFRGCSKLTSVTIGSGVKIIDEYAFSDCTSLTSITIPNNCEKLESYSFNGCTNLRYVTLGTSLLLICDHTFEDCSKLTSVTFNNTTGWYRVYYYHIDNALTRYDMDVTNSSTNAKNLNDTWKNWYWKRKTS